MKQTLNRLTVTDRTGAYKFAPPKGEPTAGPAPLFTGYNILADPEFNLFSALSGSIFWWDRIGPLGSSTYTLPYLDVTCDSMMRLPNGNCATRSLASWTMATGPYTVNDVREDQAWKVGTFPSPGPSTIAYAAYWADWSSGGGGFPGELTAFSPFMGAPFSARVEPGMSIVWEGTAQISGAVGTPQIVPYVRFYRQSWSQILTVGSFSNLSTASTLFTTTTTAPTGAFFMRASFGFTGGSGNRHTLVVHSARLGVTW